MAPQASLNRLHKYNFRKYIYDSILELAVAVTVSDRDAVFRSVNYIFFRLLPTSLNGYAKAQNQQREEKNRVQEPQMKDRGEKE